MDYIDAVAVVAAAWAVGPDLLLHPPPRPLIRRTHEAGHHGICFPVEAVTFGRVGSTSSRPFVTAAQIAVTGMIRPGRLSLLSGCKALRFLVAETSA